MNGSSGDSSGGPIRCTLIGMLRHCRPRWCFSTWLLVLLAAFVLYLVEVPGRRIGATKYAHGWPMAYLECDAVNDPSIGAVGAPSPAASFAWRAPLGIGNATASDASWEAGQLPLAVEDVLSPWSFGGGEIQPTSLAADAAFALFVLYLIGQLREAWQTRHPPARRGRFFQYRLRTLLIAVPLVAFVSARLAAWHNEYVAEQDFLSTINPAALAAGDSMQTHWRPPTWMPESLVKLCPTNWFARVDRLVIHNWGTAPPFDAIRKLRQLRSLECETRNEEDLASIGDISALAELRIRGSGMTAAGVKQLARLLRLKVLLIDSIQIDDAALAELNRLTALENLEIDHSVGKLLDLHGLKSLQSLTVMPAGERPNFYGGSNIPTIPSSTPPSGQQDNTGTTVSGSIVRPLIRLTELPNVAKVHFDHVNLDRVSCENLAGLKSLASLEIGYSSLEGRLEIAGLHDFGRLMIERTTCDAISVHNLPELTDLEITGNPVLKSLTFDRLPKLERCHIDGCPSISDVTLNDLPRLVAFDLCYPFGSDALGLGPPPMFWLRQADRLPAFNELTLTGFRFHPATAINIGRIAALQELYLSDSWVADADMRHFQSLAALRNINLVGTDVTPAGLKSIQQLPQLKKLEVGGSLVHPDRTIRAAFPPQVEIEPLLVPGRTVLDNIAESLAAARQGDLLAFWDQWNAGGSLDDNDLPVFDEFRNIQALNLWGAHVTDAGLKSLSPLVNLRALNLAETHVTDRGLWHLRNLKALEALGLANTVIDGSGFERLAGLEHLKALDLAESEITDAGLANLKYLPRLEVLRLAGTHITDVGLAHLKALPNLRRLDLSNTPITAGGLAALRDLPALRALALRNCPLGPDAAKQLAQLPSLDELELEGSELTRQQYAGLADLPHLRILNLRDFPPANVRPEDWQRFTNIREFGVMIASDLDDRGIVDFLSLRGAQKIRIAFSGELAGLWQEANMQRRRGDIIAALRKALPHAEIVEVQDWADDVQPFWTAAFARDAAGQQRASKLDLHDLGPISPHPNFKRPTVRT